MVIYPAIDLRQGKCVRLIQGRLEHEMIFSDDPVEVARRWSAAGAPWLHIVNLDGAFGKASANLQVLKDILAAVPTRIQFGGGLRDQESIHRALELGVARVVLGTAAVMEPALVESAVEIYGPDRIMVGIDAKNGLVATHGWQSLSELRAVELGGTMRSYGIERIVYTDISRDGMLAGPNLPGVQEMAFRTGLKVIASGGVSGLTDIRSLRMLEPYGVDGVIIGRALYTGDIELTDAIRVASNNGVPRG
ncbi:MAG: 1-(5-phosphoribosyl)-5-[(5-phosphoribosylamino)methylideneamino]imidazole-4-carboxamide isomerase [Chloroflexi bacterium]|nr:1-(5-phosphoribosyl)-5-[(5-phosphoribosylamino)methylideneamino]imidazole-4-carboxamide isomerase [Chloroflexota bacterium]